MIPIDLHAWILNHFNNQLQIPTGSIWNTKWYTARCFYKGHLGEAMKVVTIDRFYSVLFFSFASIILHFAVWLYNFGFRARNFFRQIHDQKGKNRMCAYTASIFVLRLMSGILKRKIRFEILQLVTHWEIKNHCLFFNQNWPYFNFSITFPPMYILFQQCSNKRSIILLPIWGIICDLFSPTINSVLKV